MSEETGILHAAVVTGARWNLALLLTLFKLRVVGLLVLASVGGALLASGGKLALDRLALLLITGTLSASGASALNQYLERGRDARMRRTRGRPLAAGALSRPEAVAEVGVALVVLAVMIALPLNMTLALFLTLGALIYVGVYTLWLKPRTLLNIVIGGAAGSCAVLSGSAAAGNWAQPSAIALALLVFVWTPTHFWSLAQAYREDYAGVGVPMLPAVVSGRASAGWIALHTAATAFVALAMSVDPAPGPIYPALVLPATLWLIWHSIRLLITPLRPQALKLFLVSNAYLGLILLAIFLGTLL